jgi:hypothetical protein
MFRQPKRSHDMKQLAVRDRWMEASSMRFALSVF